MKKLKFSPFFLVLPLVLFLYACKNDDIHQPAGLTVSFRSYGLDNRIINELQLVGDNLYAATDSGLFVKDIKNNSNWRELGLQGQVVKTFVFMDNDVCLASVSNQAKEEYKLYKSEGKEFVFHELSNNFGGSYPESLNNFTYNLTSKELLAVGNGVIAKSEDKATTWTPIYKDWQMAASGLDFIELNPHNGEIWSGGQNGIEGFTLIRHSPINKDWKEWEGLLPSPSVAKDISFDKNNPHTLLIGGEDGIIKTVDNGTTWTVIKQDHEARFYFGIDFDEVNNKRIYAASWKKDFTNPQPLILYISEDSGLNWKEYNYIDPNLFGGVWDMVQKNEGTKTKLFLGLYKGGVFEATIE